LTADEVARLFALDESLRAEADAMLAESGIGAILEEAGYMAVGSYAMRTMTWRDLDFERSQDPPDWDQHWTLGARLAKTGWLWKSSCVDGYRDPRQTPEQGSLYWGLRAADPRGGPTWKLDLHTARASEFAPGLAQRDKWMALMTEDARAHTLAIKEAVCHAPEYRDTLISVHIYEAVLEQGVRGLEAFREWWRTRYGQEAGWREKDARAADPGAWVRNP
jgi:hypothetical protein